MKLLFICGENPLHGQTGKTIFADYPGLETMSYPTQVGEITPHMALTSSHCDELIAWADIIFVMESQQKCQIAQAYAPQLSGKKLVCLNITEQYKEMDPALVHLLKSRVTPHLPGWI